MVARGYIDLEIRGDEAGVMKMLQHLDSCFTAQGMTTFLQGDVAPWLSRRAQERFDSEGDDASGRWAPLSAATRDIRAAGAARGEWAIQPAHPINVRTGDMEAYITQGGGEVTPEGSGNMALHYPRRTISATRGMRDKVRRAQVGDGRTRPRPVLAVSEVDLAEVVSKLAYFIQRGPS